MEQRSLLFKKNQKQKCWEWTLGLRKTFLYLWKKYLGHYSFHLYFWRHCFIVFSLDWWQCRWNKILRGSLGRGAIIRKRNWHSPNSLILQLCFWGVCGTQFKELRWRKEPPNGEGKRLQMQEVYLPQLSNLCHLIISNYNCISFFNVFYADIQVANEEAPHFMITIVTTCWA